MTQSGMQWKSQPISFENRKYFEKTEGNAYNVRDYPSFWCALRGKLRRTTYGRGEERERACRKRAKRVEIDAIAEEGPLAEGNEKGGTSFRRGGCGDEPEWNFFLRQSPRNSAACTYVICDRWQSCWSSTATLLCIREEGNLGVSTHFAGDL